MFFQKFGYEPSLTLSCAFIFFLTVEGYCGVKDRLCDFKKETKHLLRKTYLKTKLKHASPSTRANRQPGPLMMI
ncbi:hypothetical protein MHYP_G00228440 [Metynnis hypsauchen]